MNAIQKSEAIKAGLRKGFQDGNSKMAQRRCYGYVIGPNQLMNNSSGAQNRQTPPAQINLNPEEVNKTINKLYNDND